MFNTKESVVSAQYNSFAVFASRIESLTTPCEFCFNGVVLVSLECPSLLSQSQLRCAEDGTI
jgi:hypothetical protein